MYKRQDEYHLRLGYDVLHICQLAEMLERGGGTCRPEPLITEERSAWDLGSKGFLAIQTREDGYDYTLYHKDFTEIDGGQIDNPEISMNAARDLTKGSWKVSQVRKGQQEGGGSPSHSSKSGC